MQIKRLIILCALVFSLKAKDNFIKQDFSKGSFPGISLKDECSKSHNFLAVFALALGLRIIQEVSD